ncbi:hypothetical protein CUMW_262650 [Citrus unshiu]|uniref:Uncharacterized protein n=1 Tax=Citrus unshiu TaxID=55188 RepID=A0A2H5QUK1_CITUN|nr:hypothetical protein CUMW_262650 [Citrus unshiu]
MKLPNCRRRSTLIGLQSMTTESSSLIVQTSMSPTVPTVRINARRRCRIEAPKSVSFPVVIHGQDGVPGGRGRSESDKRELRNKIQVVAQLKFGEIDSDKNGLSGRFFQAKFPAFWPFSGDEDGWVMTAGFQASYRYVARLVRWPE